MEVVEIKRLRGIIDGLLGKFQQGAGIGAKVGIVQKSVFLKSNIHKCRVQTRDQFFDFAEIEVAHGKAHICFFVMQFHQLFIL
jgi:hypothetical protein